MGQPCNPSNQIRADEAHIWCSALELPGTDIDAFTTLLTVDEKRRAERFVLQRDRMRFIAARGILRTILGGCLDIPPARVPFVHDDNGKPSLAPPYDDRLHFNLSHSAGMGLFGVCANRGIGVDIEHIRPLNKMAAIARRFFSQNEYDRLMNARPSAREEMFFTFWSVKEACLKGSGRGLRGLGALETDIGETHPGWAVGAEYRDDSIHAWRIQTVEASPGYAAAVALEGDKDWILKYRRSY